MASPPFLLCGVAVPARMPGGVEGMSSGLPARRGVNRGAKAGWTADLYQDHGYVSTETYRHRGASPQEAQDAHYMPYRGAEKAAAKKAIRDPAVRPSLAVEEVGHSTLCFLCIVW